MPSGFFAVRPSVFQTFIPSAPALNARSISAANFSDQPGSLMPSALKVMKLATRSLYGAPAFNTASRCAPVPPSMLAMAPIAGAIEQRDKLLVGRVRGEVRGVDVDVDGRVPGPGDRRPRQPGERERHRRRDVPVRLPAGRRGDVIRTGKRRDRGGAAGGTVAPRCWAVEATTHPATMTATTMAWRFMPPIVNSAGANPPLPRRRRDERRRGGARRARPRRGHRRPRARQGHRRDGELAARLPAPPRREHGRRLVAGRAVPSRRVRRHRRRSPGQLPPRAARALRRPHRHPDVSRARRRRRSRRGPPHRRRGDSSAPPSTSPSSASARTRTSPSTIRRPISRPPTRISSSRSTRPAAGSRSAKAGSRPSATSRPARCRCRSGRSWRRARSW